jgi:hypothetical protein
MTDEEFLRGHLEYLKRYVEFWAFPELREDAMVSRNSAAYHVLDHAGMLFRYTGDERCISGLVQQPETETRDMVLSACRYVSGFTLAETIRRDFTQDVFREGRMMQVEGILMSRDALETVLWLATRLTAGMVAQGDAELRRALAQARCVAAEIDDALLARLDAVTVASRALMGIYGFIKVEEFKRAWWFTKARELDETIEDDLEKDLGLAALLDRAVSEAAAFEPGEFGKFVATPRYSAQPLPEVVSESPVRYAAAGKTRAGETAFRHYPAEGDPIVTSSIEPDTGRCILRLTMRSQALADNLVWLGIQGSESAQPGYFVVPYPHRGQEGLFFARTVIEASRVHGLDHTPVKPKVFSRGEIFGSLTPESVSLLRESALRSAEVDPCSRNGWTALLQSLCESQTLAEDARKTLLEALEALKE